MQLSTIQAQTRVEQVAISSTLAVSTRTAHPAPAPTPVTVVTSPVAGCGVYS